MYRDTDFLYEAIGALEEFLKLQIDVQSVRDDYAYDVIMDIRNDRFYGIAKRNVKNSTYGLIMRALSEADFTGNTIIIADHLPRKIAKQLKENGTNYLDAAGNAYIKTNDLFIFIEGQKSILNSKTNYGRLFQETGLKLLILLISNPETVNESYRSLAEKAEISLGSVSIIFKELEEQNFLVRTKQKRVLKNTEELIERWVMGFNEIIQPRILRKRLRIVGEEPLMERVKNSNLKIFFGGEMAAQLLTKHLKAQDIIIYSNEDLSLIGKHLKLVPDENGNIELRTKFWSDEVKLAGDHFAPSLVIYGDLMGTGNNRNIETAQLILENGI